MKKRGHSKRHTVVLTTRGMTRNISVLTIFALLFSTLGFIRNTDASNQSSISHTPTAAIYSSNLNRKTSTDSLAARVYETRRAGKSLMQSNNANRGVYSRQGVSGGIWTQPAPLAQNNFYSGTNYDNLARLVDNSAKRDQAGTSDTGLVFDNNNSLNIETSGQATLFSTDSTSYSVGRNVYSIDEKDKDFPIKNKQGRFSVNFSNQSGNELFRFSYKNANLMLGPLNPNSVPGNVNKNKVSYEEIYPSTDLRYTVEPTRLKEELIIENYTGQTDFLFEISVENAVYQVMPDSTIMFSDQVSGEPLFSIPKSFAIDNNGNRCDDVSLEFTQEGLLKLSVDRNWLKKAAYPIIIDPTIVLPGQTVTDNIEAGWCHSIAVKADGTVWTWGDNTYMQIGDGTTTCRSTPVQVGGLTGVVAVAGGGNYSLALKSDGTVWAWGSNEDGELGDGTTINRSTPVQVSFMTDVVDIAAGGYHSIALKSDGTVFAWGLNNAGQLGTGTTNNSYYRVQVSGLTGVVAVAGGFNYSLALKSDGTVRAWGANYCGQLGDGTTKARYVPVQVHDLTGVVAIAGGEGHSLALKSDGTVWAWGSNVCGELGDGTTNNSYTPVQVCGLTDVVAITVGYHNCFALKSDGTVWAWGDNDFGKLGDGTTTDRYTPVRVSGLIGVVAISGYFHTLALKSDGTLWTWGYNRYGELGDGTTTDHYTPLQVSPLSILPANPPANQMYSNLVGTNTITASGTVCDPKIGNIETVYYRIDGSAGQVGTQLGSTIIANGSYQPYSGSINVGALSEGTHILYLWVQDNALGRSGEVPIAFRVDQAPPSLSGLSVTNSTTSISVSGSATDNVSGLASNPYRFTVGSNISYWTTSTSYTRNSLTPNTQYLVKFEARDAVGHVAGALQNMYTQAQTPILTITNPTATTLDVNRTDSNPSGTLYQLITGSNYVTQTGTLTTNPTWIPFDSKKITVKGLLPNTTYLFKAYARNGAGKVTGVSSTTQGTTLVTPPANLTYTSTTDAITISWPMVTGADTYTINVDNGAEIINNGTYTSYTDPGLEPGVQHTYSVRSNNAIGSSNWSAPLIAATRLETPTNITATSTGTSITLAWSPATNATSYDVKVDGITTSTSNTRITIQGLEDNTQHTYDIRATNSVSTSNWSSEQDKFTRLDPPGSPANLNATSTNSSITITWNPVSEATTYQVSADGNIINSGSAASYMDTGLSPGTEHIYMVRAVNSGGKSAWSTPVTASTIPLAPNVPANLRAVAASATITVNWDPVENTSGYDLEIEELNQSGVATVHDITVSDTVYLQTTITPGSVYLYRVRTEIGGIPGDWSPAITVIPGEIPTGVPQNITVTPTDTSIALLWDSVKDAASYDVEENGILVGSVGAVTYTRTGLTAGTEYTYRIRAVNTAGTGDWSSPVPATTLTGPPLAIPGNIIATPTSSSICLLWNPVDGATGYEVEIDQNIIQSVTQSVYNLTDLAPTTVHTFRIRAVNGNLQGAWSAVLTATTLSDQPTTPPPGSTTASYTANVAQNGDFILVLTASDVQNLNTTSFTVTYNPDELEIEDLWATTPQADVILGNITGTDLNVTQFTPGTVVFTLSTKLSQGQSFTGLVTTVRFKAKINGSSVISTTIAFPDTAPPTILSIDPVNGTLNVPVTQDITTSFSENILQDTNFNWITLEAGDTAVTAAAYVSGNVLRIIPTTNLGYGTTYTVTIPAAAVKDTAGNSLAAEYSSSFITAGEVVSDTVAPTIISSNPENNATKVSCNQAITVDFSEDIQPGAELSSISLKMGETVVGYTYSISDSTLTITPASSLLCNTDYTLTIPADSVSDLAGNLFASTQDIRFRTIRPTVGAGAFHSIALDSGRNVWAWGANSYGQLGDGTTVNKSTPLEVNASSNITAIEGGQYHTVVLKSDGTVWTCGANSYGQLGDGTTVGKVTPVQVAGLANITAIAGGQYHTVVLKSDGTVWTWGFNGYGQLGDGTNVNRSTPVQVIGLSNIIAIAEGVSHTIALKSDGTVWTWGYNSRGQLGDGTTVNKTTPRQVVGLSGVVAIAGGKDTTIVLKSDGTVWTCGANTYGQLGDGTTVDKVTPVQVTGLSNITAIAGGVFHMIALKSDGTVWTWGSNYTGQLGDGTTVNKTTPIQVIGVANVTAIAGGTYHNIVLRADGTIWAWGSNSYGQLGDGTTSSRLTPVQVSNINVRLE